MSWNEIAMPRGELPPDEESDPVAFLQARLERRRAAREKAHGGEAEELDVEIAEIEGNLAELVLARRLLSHLAPQ
jgi:hypothetical protein